MPGLIIKLLMLALIVYVFYNFYRRIIKPVRNIFRNAMPGSGTEACPACGATIKVAKEPGSCPKCGSPLGRSPEGKLLIRIN